MKIIYTNVLNYLQLHPIPMTYGAMNLALNDSAELYLRRCVDFLSFGAILNRIAAQGTPQQKVEAQSLLAIDLYTSDISGYCIDPKQLYEAHATSWLNILREWFQE